MEILSKSLINKDLLAESGLVSYHAGVTEAEFWRGVGRTLADQRKERGITAHAIEKDGGPTNKTVQDIEAGDIGQLSKLREYAASIKVDLVDVFKAVLRDEFEPAPELELVIRKFERADLEGRAAIVAVARVTQERKPDAERPADQPGPTAQKRSSRSAAGKPRVGK